MKSDTQRTETMTTYKQQNCASTVKDSITAKTNVVPGSKITNLAQMVKEESTGRKDTPMRKLLRGQLLQSQHWLVTSPH
jgi:hypothetical protein